IGVNNVRSCNTKWTFSSFRSLSALPPKANIRADTRDVPFVPVATKVRRNRTGLFDHLVGAGKQQRRDGEASALAVLWIDDQFKFGRGLNGQFGGHSESVFASSHSNPVPLLMSPTRFTRFDCTTLFQKYLSEISKDIRHEFRLIFCRS